jgi:hypothetical protein
MSPSGVPSWPFFETPPSIHLAKPSQIQGREAVLFGQSDEKKRTVGLELKSQFVHAHPTPPAPHPPLLSSLLVRNEELLGCVEGPPRTRCAEGGDCLHGVRRHHGG